MLGGIAANHRRQTHLFDSLESRVLLAVIPVDTFDDVVNPTDHRTSLREALVRAATTAGDDRIIVPAGRYPLALGELFIDDQTGTVRIRSTRGAAVIDAQQKSRVMWIRPQSVVEMTGIVITEGRSPSSSTHSGDIGGGVLNSGTLTMTDCRITRNASGNGAMNGGIGGGLYSEGAVTMVNCTVSHNSAGNGGSESGGDGGGIFNNAFRFRPMILINCVITDNTAGSGGRNGGWGGGIATSSGTLVMTNCVVIGNQAGNGPIMFGGVGGGIAERLQGDISLTNCLIAGNIAGDGSGGGAGGGIFTAGGTLTMQNCTVHKNLGGSGPTGGGRGGGIGAAASAVVTLRRCSITANRGGESTGSNTGGHGGAMAVGGSVTLDACTIAGNAAGPGNVGGSGGAFHVTLGTLSLNNCTVTGNAAGTGRLGGGSGGAFAGFSGGSIVLTHCTITNNVARLRGTIGGLGGAIRTTGTVSLANTIVAGNFANGGGTDVSGSVTSLGYNLIGTTAGSSGWTASDLLDIDPQLEPLADNGGDTFTHALSPLSPARDRGKSFSVFVDQRGEARPDDDPNIPNSVGGDGSDIGAYEYQRPRDDAGRDRHAFRGTSTPFRVIPLQPHIEDNTEDDSVT